MSLYKFSFELEGLPKSQTNNYGHWRTRAKSKKLWEEMVLEAVLFERPERPLARARLTLTRCSSTAPDADNLCASFKPIVDGLTKAGIIEDDNMAVIGFPDYQWQKAKRGEGKVIITVEEVDPDAL